MQAELIIGQTYYLSADKTCTGKLISIDGEDALFEGNDAANKYYNPSVATGGLIPLYGRAIAPLLIPVPEKPKARERLVIGRKYYLLEATDRAIGVFVKKDEDGFLCFDGNGQARVDFNVSDEDGLIRFAHRWEHTFRPVTLDL